MGEKLVIGPIDNGLKNNREPFYIDNDSFPYLINAYQWRGRIKRKRGTSLLTRLQRYFKSTSTSYSSTSTITLDVSGNGNLLTGFSLQTNGNIVPGSVSITDTISSVVYTDPAKNGTLLPSGSINYATGAITIAASSGHAVSAIFLYYPDLPVMGIEDYVITYNQFSSNIAFDTTYSYNMVLSAPYPTYDVSFYMNPSASGTLPGYTQKITVTPTSWNGQDYQQFWTANYEGSLWATNGITFPFTVPSNIGMQFKPIITVTVTSDGPPAIASLQITGHGLVVGDFVFINEVTTTTGINFQTGYVITVTDANNVVVEFPTATISTNGTGGIAQYLTNRSDPTKDCLRYYTGDPTNGNATNPSLTGNLGWVNFAPPLSQFSYSIGFEKAQQYYLVGARIIVPFKDRLLFIGPVIQTSSANSQIYLPDTIIYNGVGTPYYTCSFTGPVTSSTVYFSMLVPVNQTAVAPIYWEDLAGFGGFVTTGVSQDINTVSNNEDVLILGMTTKQLRLIYSGNDLVPFNFFIINSELGSSSTFSTITLDRGVLSVGSRGIIISSQIATQRIDLDIPDQIFQFNVTNNGFQRVSAQRDFINEWVYFTYPSNEVTYNFPNQTLQYNYRDNSWGIFNECYTTYGTVNLITGLTWQTLPYPTWESWNEPWDSGASTLLQPKVVGGNQQGFILLRDIGTAEGNSLTINNISFPISITGATQANPAVLTANNSYEIGQQITITGVVGMTQLNGNTYTITAVTPTTVTISVNSSAFTAYVSGGTATPTNPIYSPNHCLNNGDYIVISGCLGTIGPIVNGNIYSVSNATTNDFSLNPIITSGTYLGGGVIQRMYIPNIKTKQFPSSWGMSRKTRIGPQMYLLSTTANGQIELQIYLSQDMNNPYNFGPLVPSPISINNSLVYSDILYTCPESTNLGLTPANINLQTPTAVQQNQIWHRMNTSLLGDTVQIGFTLSDIQMRDPNFNNQFAEIELHSMVIDVSPSQLLV